MASGLKILIVDENQLRAAVIEEGLREGGHTDIVILSNMQGLVRDIATIDPDVIVIDLENPSRDTLEQMFQVSRAVARPITMFVDQSDGESIQAAIEAGVSAYIVDGLKKERMKPILDTCISRFNAFRKLREELEQAKSELEARKVIDRAKSALMKLREISEEEAYSIMRRAAMNEKRKIVDIARAILTTTELLK